MIRNLLLGVPAALLLLACGSGDLPSGHWSTSSPEGAGSAQDVVTPPGDAGASASAVPSGSSSGGGSGSSGGGSSSSGSSSGGQKADFKLSVDDASLQMQLMASTATKVSISPNGYSGTVTFSAGTLPPGLSATFSPSTLKVDGSTAVGATLTVTTADSTPPGTVSLEVSASAGGSTARVAVAVAVQSVITIHIPAGVNNLGGTVTDPITTAFGPYPIKITAPASIATEPVTVYFMNDDTIPHEIHADNPDQGFGHDPGPFDGGTMDPYVRQVIAAGSYDFYLHDQNAPITVGLVEIQ